MLVAASNNKKKLRELLDILEPLGVPLRSVGDFGIASPVEDGGTFRANALIKALHTFRATGEVTLADDSGLEVDALGGAPGVESAYFAGPEGDDDANNARLVRDMRGQANRRARYRSVIALVVPLRLAGRIEGEAIEDAVVVFTEGTTEGLIVEDGPRGDGGFGYDPYFFYPPAGRTFAEMSAAEKHAVSHRGEALAKMRPVLEAVFAR